MIPWLSKIIVKYIVWDLDGTLYQNPKISKYTYDYFYNQLKKIIPTLTDKKFTELTAIHNSWSATLSHFSNQSEFAVLNQYDKAVNRSKYLSPDPKIVDLIENKLSSYHHLVLTNSGSLEANKCLQKIGFNSKTFEKIFTRDSTKLLKPDPKIYTMISDYTKSPKIRHLFVGDSIPHDVIAPQKYGFQSLPIWQIDKFL
jgi:FMN phosphatase YigB (HAD superfamily)